MKIYLLSLINGTNYHYLTILIKKFWKKSFVKFYQWHEFFHTFKTFDLTFDLPNLCLFKMNANGWFGWLLYLQREEDKKHLGHDQYYSPVYTDHTIMKEKPIQNFPSKGFNLTFFPQKNPTKYIPPAVMVQFNTLMTNHVIRIKCVAWVANPVKGENPEESQIYTANFRFLINS